MEESIYSKKMPKIKKALKILYIATLVLGIASLLVICLFNAFGVFSIKTATGTKYGDGFTYPGYQAIFYGYGEMIIQGYTESSFNPITFSALLVALIGVITCLVLLHKNKNKKGTNTKRAIIAFVLGVVILYSSIVLFNCDKLWIWSAKQVNGAYSNYYSEYLEKALNGEVYFKKEAYPTILLIVGIISSLVSAGYGATLIYQKQFAKKYKSKETK